MTVIDCTVPPLSCTEEFDRVQVGGGVTAGVIPHVRLTTPENDPDGPRDKVNVALCPGLTDFELDDPDASEIVKSGAASPVPVRATPCGLPGAVSITARFAMRDPPAVGVNFTLTVQVPTGAKAPPQLFVWVKSELFIPAMLIPLTFSEAFPVFSMTMAAGLLLTPTACGEKFCWLGYDVRKGPFTPVPLSAIASGLIRVLSVIVTLPDCDPVVVGEKVTLT